MADKNSIFKYDSSTQVSFRNLAVLAIQGNSGGLTITGGTGSGNALNLVSTSNATKGLINFGSNTNYDDTNQRIQIGASNPGVASYESTGTQKSNSYTRIGNGAATIDLRKANAGTTTVALNDTVTNFNVFGYDGTSYVNQAQITTKVDAAVSTGVVPISIGFFTTAAGGSAVQRGIVSSAGSWSLGNAVAPANGLLTVGTNTTTAAGGFYLGTDTNLYRFASAELRTDGLVGVKQGGSTSFARVGGSIFNHFADANNGTTVETDLYSDTIPASALGTNGDKLIAQYGGIFTGAATSTQQLKLYFAGTVIFDSGALAIGAATTDSWNVQASIIRVSSTVVRCSVSIATNFATLLASATYTEITGLTLSNTNILKITGTAAGVSGASNQITAKESYVQWWPAA